MDFGFVLPYKELIWWALAAVAALAGIYAVLRGLERFRMRRLERFIELKLAPRLFFGHDDRLRRPFLWLPLLGFVFGSIALAQPHWGRSWEEVHRRSHDVLIVLDISESMRAENPLPNRLERAKQKLFAILDRSPGDRFGLIAFSGTAETMCPLTLDKGYFRSVLSAVDTDSISMEGTDIAAALNKCVEIFKELDKESEGSRESSRSILLISDGESVSGDAIAAAKIAGSYARVFVIGVGDPDGTLISYTDPLGRKTTAMAGAAPHVSKLDEKTLGRIAVAGRGAYARSTPDNSDIDEIYGLIERMAVTTASGEVHRRLMNRYQWPLALAVLCFAGEGLWCVLLPYIRRTDAKREGAQLASASLGGQANA